MAPRVSEHWQPDGDSARWTQLDGYAPQGRQPWPSGATAGLVLVAAGCLLVGALLYRVAGPRDVVDENAVIGRNGVDERSGLSPGQP
jgi:hypothetical protein